MYTVSLVIVNNGLVSAIYHSGGTMK